MIASLDDRALVRVAGGEAENFLQNLITCDIEGLSAGEANFGALLTPQGKICFDFFIIRMADEFLLDVTTTMRDDLIRRLNFYKLRARVDIGPAGEDPGVHAVWGGRADIAGGTAIADPRLEEMGARLYGAKPPKGKAGNYEAHRLALGMPEGGKDYVYGDCFPHEALMDQFGGVDFAKGCYVGQEVVSRMEHRGTARTRIIMVEAKAELPPFSTEIMAGGKPAGTMGSSAGNVGLARLRLDRVHDAVKAGAPVTAGAQAISVRLQPWVRFGWPQE